MRPAIAIAAVLSIGAFAAHAAARDLAPIVSPQAAAPGKAVQPYVRVDAPVVALLYACVIDGTGAPARANQIILAAAIGAGTLRRIRSMAGGMARP